MELEKRKREDDGGSKSGRTPRPRLDDGGALKGPVPEDEEVEEFFAILKRIQVAVKYFQDRNRANREITAAAAAAPCWSPTFEREDFDGVKTEGERSEGNHIAGLDLNTDPVCEGADL